MIVRVDKRLFGSDRAIFSLLRPHRKRRSGILCDVHGIQFSICVLCGVYDEITLSFDVGCMYPCARGCVCVKKTKKKERCAKELSRTQRHNAFTKHKLINCIHIYICIHRHICKNLESSLESPHLQSCRYWRRPLCPWAQCRARMNSRAHMRGFCR